MVTKMDIFRAAAKYTAKGRKDRSLVTLDELSTEYQRIESLKTRMDIHKFIFDQIHSSL
jgi:hypothetical protein